MIHLTQLIIYIPGMKGIFLDIETTGLNPLRHKPIEIAFEIVDFSENKRISSYQTVIKQPRLAWETKDTASLEINGFTFDEVSSGKDTGQVSLEIESIFKDLGIERTSDAFICQNPAFDRTFFSQIVEIRKQEELKWPYHWFDLASMFFGIQVLNSLKKNQSFPQKLPLSKNSIAESLNLPKEGSPHRAKAGVTHLMLCYQALFGISFE